MFYKKDIYNNLMGIENRCILIEELFFINPNLHPRLYSNLDSNLFWMDFLSMDYYVIFNFALIGTYWLLCLIADAD